MSLLGNTGIINWIGKPEYDLSWLDAENIRVRNTDLSLLRPNGDSAYTNLAVWIDDFRDRDVKEIKSQPLFTAMDEGVIPPTALVWGAGKDDENNIDDLYDTHLIPKIYISHYDWWICKDFEYTQAVIDKVKELDLKKWTIMQEGRN